MHAFREILIFILPLAYISVNTKSLSGIVAFTSIFKIEKASTKSSASSILEIFPLAGY